MEHIQMDTADRPGLVSLAARTAPAPIASMLHFAGLLVITACVVALGFYSQSDSAGATPDGQLASHAMAIQIYIFAIALDWGLFWYCWFGMRRRNCSLWTLADLRWISWRSIVVDILFALALWIIWEGTDHGVSGLLGPSVAKSVDNLLPQSLLEIIVWIITSLTAGICEESVFRGYVQRQVHALTGNRILAVITQGAIFGLYHAYQGWKHVVIICALGILYGAFAAWRGTLRINILTHAWGDLWEGWLKFVVWR